VVILSCVELSAWLKRERERERETRDGCGLWGRARSVDDGLLPSGALDSGLCFSPQPSARRNAFGDIGGLCFSDRGFDKYSI
jgi:hypothetical protein